MRQQLPAHPSSVRRARHLLRAELKDTAHECLSEAAELVVSELVTNAILHTGEIIELTSSLEPQGLHVEVADRGTHIPIVASYDALASTGRGLLLVSELTDQWGAEGRPDGKTMWFRIGLASPDDSTSGTAMSVTGNHSNGSQAADAVEVVLLNFPALAHGAWHKQAKSMLRDLLLLGIDSDPAGAIESHAAAMDAMAILEEQVGAREATEDLGQLLASTVEPHASLSKVRLVVPRESVPHFTTLDRELRQAWVQAAAGRLLTPPLHREFAFFREWMCEEVRLQAAGQNPRRWIPPELPSPGHLVSVPTEAEAAVNDSDRALVGANGAGSVVAASPAAAELLGYPSAAALVGRRLLDISRAATSRRTSLASAFIS
ncbi:ATP-binding protein [Nocardioides piscis]|uniref:ATP-binding protein n=1 Tax=Nocardioides piscis TaxID=2714938 RepID=A0A6G7YK66_9ACTN|nr:ATP-binding protein [Nocardioides piscis]QIK77132.1 ATP-binding protein [Nocardioides piscis]